MRTTVLVVSICVLCLVGSASLVLGSIGCGGGGSPPSGGGDCTVVVEQSALGGTNTVIFGIVSPPNDIGQTVTFGAAGRLTRFDVLGFGYLTGPGPLVLEVRNVIAPGLPAEGPAALLGSVSIDVALLPTTPSTVSFDLASFAIDVYDGRQIAFVLRSNGAEMSVDVSAADNYAGGEGVQFQTSPPMWSTLDGADLGFQAYVCVDEIRTTSVGRP